MGDFQDDAQRRAVKDQLNSLYDAGVAALEEEQNLNAANILRRGLVMAESIGDENEIIKYRSRLGFALECLHKITEALEVLSPAVYSKPTHTKPDYIFDVLLRYIGLAQFKPVKLTTIEKAILQAESFLRDAGKHCWRHNILLQRAELLVDRGYYSDALKIAQEAWAIYNDEFPSVAKDYYLYKLFFISILLNDAILAQKYLQEWESIKENPFPKYRERLLYMSRAILARLTGNSTEAVDLARRALLQAEQIDSYSSRRNVFETLLRALLISEEVTLSRETLGRFLTLRYSESLFTRYNIRVLVGDYHMACARLAAGMPPADDDLGQTFPPPLYITNPEATRYCLQKARFSYKEALKIGRLIDERLECIQRQEEIAKRFSRITDIENALRPL